MVKPSKEQILEKYEGEDYPIQIIGRHVEITPAIKNYAEDKLKKSRRFGGRIIEAMIVMDIQKLVHTVDFILNINNTRVKVTGKSSNMYAAVDEAISHLESKLRRYTKRLHMHRASPAKDIDMNVNIIQSISPIEDINDEIEEASLRQAEEELKPHPVVSKEIIPLKTLTMEEAIVKMELGLEPFLLYRSEDDRKLKVLYRRDDGNFGLMEPE